MSGSPNPPAPFPMREGGARTRTDLVVSAIVLDPIAFLFAILSTIQFLEMFSCNEVDSCLGTPLPVSGRGAGGLGSPAKRLDSNPPRQEVWR